MICPAFPARLDVMNLQTIRRIAQSAPETIPFVYRPPGLVVDAGTHIPFHVFVPSFLPPSCGTKGHHGKARAGASPLCITLAAVIYWECARGVFPAVYTPPVSPPLSATGLYSCPAASASGSSGTFVTSAVAVAPRRSFNASRITLERYEISLIPRVQI